MRVKRKRARKGIIQFLIVLGDTDDAMRKSMAPNN